MLGGSEGQEDGMARWPQIRKQMRRRGSEGSPQHERQSNAQGPSGYERGEMGFDLAKADIANACVANPTGLDCRAYYGF